MAFDDQRRLWTADVRVDATFGYRPFVHLHVCRYQPHALDGQHLSGTVALAPLRLGAPRRVVLTRQEDGQAQVRLTGPDAVNVVTVVVQKADGTTADPDLRWRDLTTTVLTRAGTTALAVHEGLVSLPATGTERRLAVEDAEPVTVDGGGAPVAASALAYREVAPVPADG